MGKRKKSPPPPTSGGSRGDFTITIQKGDEILISADITIHSAGGAAYWILKFMETVKGGHGGNSHAIFQGDGPPPHPTRGKPNKNKKKKKDEDFISTKQ